MGGHRKFAFAAIVPAVLSLEPCLPASAGEQGPVSETSQSAELPQGSDEAEIRELRERLDQRDAVIRNLIQRVEQLERERSAAAPDRAAPEMPVASGPPSMPATAAEASSPATPPAAMTPEPPSPGPGPAAESAEPPSGGPGSFAVSDEDAQRALERALIQTGAALLPPGQFEFVPSVTYQLQRTSQPSQIALTTEGTVLITEDITRTTQLEAGALLRVGLPFNAQAEIGLPWDFKDITVASRVVGAGLKERNVSVQGVGDLSISLTKQILVESDLRPGLFVSGAWNSNLGETKQKVPLGTGFDEFIVGATAVKRQDPLVFTGGFIYQTRLTHNGLKPGDQYIPSLGLLFAVSPETSLRFSQQITFEAESRLNGNPIPGSEKTFGIFTFGVLSVLGRGLVVNLTGGIGETADAPDIVFQLGLPTRF